MEKAILRTLIYANIFNYPLTIFEIHKWLISKKATLRQVEKALKGLREKGKVRSQKNYYFLPRRAGLVEKRRRRERQSDIYLRKARILASLLKLIPWIKLVGISGGLAMGNTSKKDDIDLFIITAKNRLWISRVLTLGLLSLIGQRRKVGEKGREIAGKLCINTLLEEDRLEQNNKDIYLAHEILQMKALWQRDGMYGKYLSDNEWVFKFLPNWVDPALVSSSPAFFNWIPAFAGMTLEKLAKWLQLKIMVKPQGMERIEDGALYFHPNDIRLKILKLYKQKISKL